MARLGDAALAGLRDRVRREVDAGRLPAAQLAVGLDGEVVHVEAFGAAGPDTRFTVFSVTKAVVAAVVWQLLAEGKLTPDTAVTDLVPAFAAADGVTVRHLLTHTGGFPLAPLGPPEWSRREDRLARFGRWQLRYPPGEHFEYHATAGHWVLAEMVEVVEGHDLRTAVAERVTGPLGLDRFLLGGEEAGRAEVAELTPVGSPPSAADVEEALGVADVDLGEVTPEVLLEFNDPAVRAVGIPGGGGIADAATIAALYQAFLHDPEGLWDPAWLRAGTAEVHCALPDPVKGIPANRTLGLVLAGDDGNAALRGMGHTASPRTFGHNGAGGQIAWADPETGLSFAFCTSAVEADFLREGRRTAALGSRAGALLR
jgi:CubicO group peptidase (beta-lactamase class C family)